MTFAEIGKKWYTNLCKKRMYKNGYDRRCLMFQIGDTVFYSGSGVCRIDSVTSREFGDSMKDYYVLIPVHAPESAVYLPVDNAKLLSRMRFPLSKDEVMRLIHTMPKRACSWITDENRRKQEYQRILREGDQGEIMVTIHSIFVHQKELKNAGRKLHQCDERAFRECQRVLNDEFSHVLHIRPDEVADYIEGVLEGA